MTDAIAAFVLGLPVWVALLVVFALPALESSAFVGFVFPGEIALILGGVLAFQGQVSLVAVLLAGIGGAIVGDSVGYLVGRRYGRGILEGTLGRFVSHRHFDRAEKYLAERGGKAVFFGRFTAALRVMIPGLCGMSRMHYPKFAAYNVAGGVVWGSLCVLLGYLGGSSWRRVEHLASRIGLGALAVVVVLFALGYFVRRLRGEWWHTRWSRVQRSRAVARLHARFPGQVAWTGKRLDPASRTGLALTVAVATAAATTWTFLGITQDVVAQEELALLDPRASAWLADLRTGWVTQAAHVVIRLGDDTVLVAALVLTGMWLVRRTRSWFAPVTLLAVYGGALILQAITQSLVAQAGQPDAAVAGADGLGWVYPSAHTLQATVAWGVIGLSLLPSLQGRLRTGVLAGWTLTVVAVGAGELYLGTSSLTGVLAGMSLGIAVLSVYEIVGRLVDAGKEASNGQPARGRP